MFDVVIIGGGAAGFYAAIHIAEENPSLKVAIIERGKQVLSKVRVSGGGRCNVTHATFVPTELVKNYPRGEKELMGPFHTYATGDTVDFFERRGITLKIEEDGRIFPTSNSSQTIIDCFLNETARLGVKVIKSTAVTGIFPPEKLENEQGAYWKIETIRKDFHAKKVIVAAGSSPKVWTMLEALGHTIVPPVPSLFTFNIKDPRIKGIQGISTEVRVSVSIEKNKNSKLTTVLKSKKIQPIKLTSEGPLLITHWGMSGPAILKLSAWGARILHDCDYMFKATVNWLPEYHKGGIIHLLMQVKEIESKKTVLRTNAVDLPRRLWINLVKAAGISETTKWADVSKLELQKLSEQLTESEFEVLGKSTFKEEFVTAGGVDLKEINFKTYESKIHPQLYFAGEVINVDAITGGFNFQNAWTGAYIAAKAIVSAV
ncbi:BaiN/RdsA family NAD(P)/FAD-dependent oxidoreductase [Spongiimicrobium salis]|uniref:NAD(P)/FAD-dependent oxidoreductase n=1 Tax=Spongiimicrobium salis TaxID=1667022 RepID=UPI00374CDDF3